MGIKEISKIINRPIIDKTLFGDAFGLAKTLAEFNKSYSKQFDGLLSGFEAVNHSLLKSATGINNIFMTDSFNSFLKHTHMVDLGIKKFIENNNAAIERITKSTLNSVILAENPIFQSMKLLNNSKLVESVNLIQKNLGHGIFDTINQLKLNPNIRNGLTDFLEDIQINSDRYQEILSALELENEDKLKELGLFNEVHTWVISHLKDVQDKGLSKILASVVLYFLVQLYLQDKATEFFKEHIIKPHVCIARSGCNIREQGRKESKRLEGIPSGAELAVVEDKGRWKKVLWVKDSGDVVEGWVSSSLLKWKITHNTSEVVKETLGKHGLL